jgi:hypothetical protein
MLVTWVSSSESAYKLNLQYEEERAQGYSNQKQPYGWESSGANNDAEGKLRS